MLTFFYATIKSNVIYFTNMSDNLKKIYIIEQLKKFDLSQKDIEIYLCLLKNGPSSIQQVVDSSGFVRSSVYQYVENLIDRGFITESIINKKRIYIPINPEKIKDVYELEKMQFEQFGMSIPDIISDIKKMYPEPSKSSLPILQYYEGEKGIMRVYEDTLKEGKNIFTFTAWDEMLDILPQYLPEYVRRRAAAGIHSSCIALKTKISKEIQLRDKEENRTTKFIESNEKVSVETIIYGNKFAMLYFSDQAAGVIIENEDFAKAQKMQFLALWNSL